LEGLDIDGTDLIISQTVVDYKNTLEKMTTLKKLSFVFRFNCKSNDEIKILRHATHALNVEVDRRY